MVDYIEVKMMQPTVLKEEGTLGPRFTIQVKPTMRGKVLDLANQFNCPQADVLRAAYEYFLSLTASQQRKAIQGVNFMTQEKLKDQLRVKIPEILSERMSTRAANLGVDVSTYARWAIAVFSELSSDEQLAEVEKVAGKYGLGQRKEKETALPVSEE